MESIYRKYNDSIRTVQFVLVYFVGLLSSPTHAQITQENKKEITAFVNDHYLNLLQKSKDYSVISIDGEDLKSSLVTEFQELNFNINTNAIIEYDITKNQGKDIIITDKMIPFLINYAGKKFSTPSVDLECIVNFDNAFLAFYNSRNIVSDQSTLRKMIFKEVNGIIELRRISFAEKLPISCKVEDIHTIESNTATITSESFQKNQLTIPRIIIREALQVNGEVFVYGFIDNYKTNGILTDLETGTRIKVSTRDGFFVMRKFLTVLGFKELNLKYDYGQKFIMDKKLVFLK
ncbi:MAG: hypothetical protein V3V00_01945 [Saprospiraceae bacterium]